MSQSYLTKLNLTLGSGDSESNAIRSNQIHDAAAIGIIAPSGLEAATYVIEVNTADDESGDWATLKDRDGNTVFVPAASEAAWYPELPSFPAFRIKRTAGTAGADRVFTVLKTHTV